MSPKETIRRIASDSKKSRILHMQFAQANKTGIDPIVIFRNRRLRFRRTIKMNIDI
jgi:hypothetical protein